jgi:hypothetical protein
VLFDVYRDRTVLVTGHTGFKAAWLATWLLQLGARVTGIADRVPTSPSHFDSTCLKESHDFSHASLAFSISSKATTPFWKPRPLRRPRPAVNSWPTDMRTSGNASIPNAIAICWKACGKVAMHHGEHELSWHCSFHLRPDQFQ